MTSGREIVRGVRKGVGAARNKMGNRRNSHLGFKPDRSHIVLSSHPEAERVRGGR
jgi:hypothetical protein